MVLQGFAQWSLWFKQWHNQRILLLFCLLLFNKEQIHCSRFHSHFLIVYRVSYLFHYVSPAAWRRYVKAFAMTKLFWEQQPISAHHYIKEREYYVWLNNDDEQQWRWHQASSITSHYYPHLKPPPTNKNKKRISIFLCRKDILVVKRVVLSMKIE